MIYSLLRDREMAGWSPLLEKDGAPLSMADVVNGLDESLEQIGDKVGAVPIEWVADADTITRLYFDLPERGKAQHVTKIRNPRPGKPDPETWGWQPSDGLTPPGLDS